MEGGGKWRNWPEYLELQRCMSEAENGYRSRPDWFQQVHVRRAAAVAPPPPPLKEHAPEEIDTGIGSSSDSQQSHEEQLHSVITTDYPAIKPVTEHSEVCPMPPPDKGVARRVPPQDDSGIIADYS